MPYCRDDPNRPAEMISYGGGLCRLSWLVPPPNKWRAHLLSHGDIVAKFSAFCQVIDESLGSLNAPLHSSLDAEAFHMCAAWSCVETIPHRQHDIVYEKLASVANFLAGTPFMVKVTSAIHTT